MFSACFLYCNFLWRTRHTPHPLKVEFSAETSHEENYYLWRSRKFYEDFIDFASRVLPLKCFLISRRFLIMENCSAIRGVSLMKETKQEKEGRKRKKKKKKHASTSRMKSLNMKDPIKDWPNFWAGILRIMNTHAHILKHILFLINMHPQFPSWIDSYVENIEESNVPHKKSRKAT